MLMCKKQWRKSVPKTRGGGGGGGVIEIRYRDLSREHTHEYTNKHPPTPIPLYQFWYTVWVSTRKFSLKKAMNERLSYMFWKSVISQIVWYLFWVACVHVWMNRRHCPPPPPLSVIYGTRMHVPSFWKKTFPPPPPPLSPVCKVNTGRILCTTSRTLVREKYP